MIRRPLITADRVTVAYGATAVISDVDLVVAEGDMLGIVGPSGSGKSTLIRALMGSIAPRSGTVRREPGLTVGFVPQVEQIDWNFPVTVAECVAMARATRWSTPWISKAERIEIDSVLDRLGLHALGRRHIRNLSGGQQQRVFLARALFTGAEIIFLDEPTSGLDVKTRHEVLHLLADLNAEGVTIVLTTHDLNGIATHLPLLVCLNNVVIGAGPPEEVLVPDVLERTFGSPMQILEHGGMRVIVDGTPGPDARVLPFTRRVGA